MSENYNRKRNQTVTFRLTPEEKLLLEARIKVSGLPKGEYFRKSFLDKELKIATGKYQSDRLSVELKRLREDEKVIECKALLDCLLQVIKGETDE